jgi:glycosyltransferase involved in cell wall biosynthesis
MNLLPPRPPSSDPAPLVSVGLPVYNGEQFLAVAIESILGQSLGDLELIISDNASTDDTARIARQYAEKDRRVRYLRQAHNVGVNRNYNFALLHARGSFFKWISSSDYCAPTLLAKCCDVLSRDPGAILCFAQTRFVDEQGRELAVSPVDFAVLAGDPVQRFEDVCVRLSINSPLNAGVIRTAALRRTGPMGSYRSADAVLMAALALQGRFVLLPEVLFFRRTGSAHSTPDRTLLQIERLHNPNAKHPSRLVWAHRHMGRLAAVLAAPLALRDRIRGVAVVLRLLYWRQRELLSELVAALRRRRSI